MFITNGPDSQALGSAHTFLVETFWGVNSYGVSQKMYVVGQQSQSRFFFKFFFWFYIQYVAR